MTDQPNREPVTHAPYRREPYVRANLDDGTVVDGKAIGWTQHQVDVKWRTPDGKTHVQWMGAEHVQRIKRSESAWHDPYDDYEHYAALGEL